MSISRCLQKNKTIGAILIACLASLTVSTARAESSLDELPGVLAKLDSGKPEIIIEALSVMGRICDESCVTYVADMLRSDEVSVVLAACKTATALANPMLSAPLLDVMYHHPVDEVRDEALRALARQGVGYEEIFMTVDPLHPDELQKRIVRSLPPDLCEEKADEFAKLATYHAFSTSVAQAYRNQPELLMNALIRLYSEASGDAKENLLRTMALISNRIQNDFLSPEMQRRFWTESEDYYDSIALIQAARLTPDAMSWLLVHAEKLTDPELLDVIYGLNSVHAAAFVASAFQDDALKNRILHCDSMLKKCRDWVQDNPSLFRHLANMKYSPEAASNKLLETIYDSGEGIKSIHLIADRPELLPEIVQLIAAHPNQDRMGAVYLARWALVLTASRHPEILNYPEIQPILTSSRSLCYETRRLHAEPALELLRLAGIIPEAPEKSIFSGLRPDMKAAWLRILPPNPELIGIALRDSSEISQVAALRSMSVHHVDAENLCSLISNGTTAVKIQASAAAAALGRTDCLPDLENRLTDSDARVAYNALWAMQQLHALPPDHLLKSLYYRAPDGYLRERLGFLSGLVPGESGDRRAFDLESGQMLDKGQIVQLTTRQMPMEHHEIDVILEDQSIGVHFSNGFGMFIF